MKLDEELNEKLDKCACLMVECYDEILQKRELLNKCLSDGYLNLSKARAIIGCTNLSMLQVPAELEPVVTVDVSEQREFHKTDLEAVNLQFETDKFALSIAERSKPNVDKKNSDESDDEQDQSNKKQAETKRSSANNNVIPCPNWFGVLTPLSLKTSQKSFSRSLFLIVSLCELQCRLHSLKQTYDDLLKSKSE